MKSSIVDCQLGLGNGEEECTSIWKNSLGEQIPKRTLFKYSFNSAVAALEDLDRGVVTLNHVIFVQGRAPQCPFCRGAMRGVSAIHAQ